MVRKGNSLFMIKVIAAMLSAVISTIYFSWRIYTPLSERLSTTEYSPFIGIFAFNFVPIFFISIIMGPMLSPVMDRIIYKRFNLTGLRSMLIVVFSYLLLGMVSAILVSLIFSGTTLFFSYISISLWNSMVFLFIQKIFQWCFFKPGKRGSI